MKMPSIMRAGSRFAKTPSLKVPRSVFDRSHGNKFTFDQGRLIPCFVDEVIPGDTLNLKMTAFARLNTPIHPIMDNMYLNSFFFFVPMRLIWDNWTKFMGEQEDPDDSIAFTIPISTVPAAGYNTGNLEDYMGLPVGVGIGSPAWEHSCLPIRAYYRIFNDWFRDQNVHRSVSMTGVYGVSPTYGNGPDVPAAGGCVPQFRMKRHDYFTSCLPWQQKGTAVDVPYGSVVADGTFDLEGQTSGSYGDVEPASGGAQLVAVNVRSQNATNWTSGEDLQYHSGLDITPATVNELREAVQIQKLLERDARSGTRYPETLMAHWGVEDPQMAVLQRPEYLGGGRAPINVSATPQTGPTTDGAGAAGTPQGNLAGIGTMVANNHGFVKSFTEHGYVIGIIEVSCDLTYQQGMERFWSRSTRYDFYYPEFAHLGEQAVLNKEIYTQGNSSDDSAFGYQERYAEYRYKPSRIGGLFRSNPSAGTSLDPWHLSEDFASLPTLNHTFMLNDLQAEVDRAIAVPSEPHFYFDGYFKYICARPMPVYSVPGLIDHF